MLSFDLPWIFMILPLPILFRLLLTPQDTQHTSALRVPFFQHAKNCHRDTAIGSGSWWHSLLLGLIWLLLVTSAAQPSWVGEPLELPSSGRDLMLAVDISESMKTPDFSLNNQQVDRLVAVKSVLRDFIKRREHDRIGLVLFGSQAYLQTPLTFDRTTVQQLLEEAQIGMAGPQTAIGDGIGLALKRLQAHASASRVLILLTDGANTAGAIKPRKAAELAATSGLKIYTVGVGSDQMVTSGLFGLGRQVVNPSADLDEQTLKDIAKLTDGQYFRAKDLKELNKIYAFIDELEPIEVDKDVVQPKKRLFHWPLTAVLLLSLLLLLSMTQRIPTLHPGSAS